MLALTLINTCAREYQDVAFERIAKSRSAGANWLEYLNDAQRAIVLVRPDANPITQSVQLVAGTRQALPSGGLRLLDAVRNTGSAGTSNGPAVRVVERQSMDMADRGWHSAPPSITVREVLYDEKKTPLTYFVSPPVPAAPNVYLEIIFSKTPTDVTDPDAGSITISDVYVPAMQHWMLYRAYAMATQAVNQFQRSNFYFQAFFNILGIKLRGDMFTGASAPNIYPQPVNATR